VIENGSLRRLYGARVCPGWYQTSSRPPQGPSEDVLYSWNLWVKEVLVANHGRGRALLLQLNQTGP
jgi:hypothetical protein